MKRTRFTEKPIIGVSEATIYNSKAKYGGLEVSEARRLKELGSENAKLKRLLADAMLDQAALTRRTAKPTIFWQKGSDARRAAGSGCSSSGVPRDERTAGMPCHRCRSQERALPFRPGR